MEGAKSKNTMKTADDMISLAHYHKFIRDDVTDEQNKGDWKLRMTRRYYDKLFKEFAIADLSRYESGELGMRWRTETEVVNGKGQIICGARKCESKEGLRSFEVPFKYQESGESKLELVKVRLCNDCSQKLSISLQMKDNTQSSRKKRSSSPLTTSHQNQADSDKTAKKSKV